MTNIELYKKKELNKGGEETGLTALTPTEDYIERVLSEFFFSGSPPGLVFRSMADYYEDRSNYSKFRRNDKCEQDSFIAASLAPWCIYGLTGSFPIAIVYAMVNFIAYKGTQYLCEKSKLEEMNFSESEENLESKFSQGKSQ